MIVKKLIASKDPDVNLLDERRKYTVYSVLLDEQIKFLVEDDNVFSFPFFIPSSDLEIVDGTVSKYWKYSGPLPHGLVAADTRESVEKKLGTPKRRNERSDNYFIDGLVWTVAFEGEKLQFLQFDLPDNGKREHGICP